MKDYFGSPLEIGDYVAFTNTNASDESFLIAKIVAFTPQNVVISFKNDINYSNDEMLIYPNDVIKAPPGYKNS